MLRLTTHCAQEGPYCANYNENHNLQQGLKTTYHSMRSLVDRRFFCFLWFPSGCIDGCTYGMVIVAQLVRALVCGTRGRGFESRLSPTFVQQAPKYSLRAR